MSDNWGLIGHQWAVELLRSHLDRGGPRHAYLFTGPHGTGRRTLALRFAEAINAEPMGTVDPAGKLHEQFGRMQHPDLSVVQRQEGDRDLKIEAVRDLQRTLSLAPYMSNYRIALLLNFEDANPSAANAVLKTLEEPNPRVVILVTAESGEALLPTIVSRCEVVRLRPVPLEMVAEGLQNQYDVEPEQARLLAHIASGRPGYAIHLSQNPEILEQRRAWLDEQFGLLSGDRVARFSYAEGMSKDKELLPQQLLVWLAYWRDVLMRVSRSQAPLVNLDRAEEINRLAAGLDLSSTRRAVLALEGTLDELRANINVRLAAETLLLELPYLSAS
jgi:DNA polymerase-3 subunit delta'